MRKVLVADNSIDERKVMIRSLLALGAGEPVEAADGEAALRAFSPGEFSLVLADWTMPGKSGLEVIREIRALDAEVPIVVLTGGGEREDVLEAIAAGVNDYLFKPLDGETLRERLGRFGA